MRRSLRDLEQIAEDGEIILEKIRQRDSGCPSDPLINNLSFVFFEGPKVPFSELNDFLVSIKPYGSIANVLPLSQIKCIQDIFDKTVDLNESTEFIIHRAAMPRIKRARLTRVTINEIDEQITKITEHPIQIFGVEDIKVTVLTHFFHLTLFRQSKWLEQVGKKRHPVFVLMELP